MRSPSGRYAPTFDQAWIGALAYTFQLYFDFSGYSDMAIGISLMFGIFLPLNFNSPYKATSIIDFWRRWHMTLSQFLRDYLYIPLGGNRRGPVLRYVNLMITMLLGGLWHGAAWTFVVWGALHGAYLCINHAWNNYGPKVAPRFAPAADVAGLDPDISGRRHRLGVLPRRQYGDRRSTCCRRWPTPAISPSAAPKSPTPLFIAVYAALAWFAPNTQEIMGYDHKNRTVGENLGAWRLRPLLLYASRGRAGVRDSRNPAAQRIHLFQVLMSTDAGQKSAEASVRGCRDRAVGGGAELSSSIPCSCSGPRGCFRRCIRRTRACRMPG